MKNFENEAGSQCSTAMLALAFTIVLPSLILMFPSRFLSHLHPDMLVHIVW